MLFFRCWFSGISSKISLFITLPILILSGSLITVSHVSAEEVIVCRNSACTDSEGRTIYATFESALSAVSGGSTIIARRSSADPTSYYYLSTTTQNNYNVLTNPNDDTINYPGNLGFGSKIIHLKKDENETAECIIRGGNTGNSTVYIQSEDAPGSIIEGFTIIGDRGVSNGGNGGCMSIRQKVSINQCLFRDSSAEFGGAVYIAEPLVKPIFKNCIFRNNRANKGGAVYVYGPTGALLTPDNPPLPIFQNCLFSGNDAVSIGGLFGTPGDGDVFYFMRGTASIVNCTMVGNNSSDALIYYEKSLVPLQITNSILYAINTGDQALVSETGHAESQEASFVNTFVRGTYEYLEGAVQYVYEPTRVLVNHEDGGSAQYMSYTSGDNNFVYNVSGNFQPTFADTQLYYLTRDSSFIGLGLNYLGTDYDGEPRPFILSPGPDLGWDEFSFCHLIDENIGQGTIWSDISSSFDVIDADDPYPVTPILADVPLTTWFQNGKVRYYRIIVPESGVMRIWSTGSTVDSQGILFRGCDNPELIASDGKNGTWLNFHIDHPYAEQGEDYYLAVVNQSKTENGTIDLFGLIQTDDYANTCAVADTEQVISFSDTYFNLNAIDRVKPIPSSDLGKIDFVEDEDVFRLEFAAPGTLVVTSQMAGEAAVEQTTPKYIKASIIVKNADGSIDVVAEQKGTGSISLMYDNTTGGACYLRVKKNLDSEDNQVQYAFDAVYYPLDEGEKVITLNNSNGDSGFITYPGDKDYFTFVVPSGQAGTITAYTRFCTAGSKIDIYNPLHEKIEDNGALDGDDYNISKALSLDNTEIDFFVTSGIYYVRVSPYNSHTTPFPYTLFVTFASSGGDVHANNWELATIVYPWKDSSSMTGEPELYYETKSSAINSSDDTDFFRIDVPYKSKLDIMVTNATRDVAAQLLDSQGKVLGADTDIRTANPACQTDGSTTGIYSDVEEGKYYIRLSAGGSTNYVLNIDLDDFPDTPSSSEALAAEWMYSRLVGHIETVTPSCGSTFYDKDIFRIQVPNNNQYRIYTTGNSNTAATLYQCTNETCSVSSPYTTGWSTYYAADYDGHNFAISLGDPESSPVSYDQYGIPLTAGTYAVEVRMQNPATDTGEYTIHIKQRDDYCNDNTCTTSPPVGSLTSVDGTLRTKTGVLEVPGDIDYFTCVPTANGRLVLKEPLGQKPDLIFKLMDATNDRLTYSSAGDLEFDVKQGVTYYVSVNPVYTLNTGDYSFTYQLTNLGSNGDDDGEWGTSPGNNFAQARLLHPDNSVVTAEYSGSIDLAGDYDYYYFTITGAGALRIFSGGGTDTYGYLFLQEKNMYNLVMSDDDSGDGRNFEINYYINGLETDTHTYYLKVRGYSTTETGDYSLYIYFNNAIDVDDHGDECETATPVSLNTGSLEGSRIVYTNSHIGIPGDNDYFKVVAGPVRNLNNEDILIDPGMLTVYTSNATVDTFGYLKDQVCGTKALNDNGSDPADGQNFRLSYAPDCTAQSCTPKVYHVLARSYSGTETGAYTFNVESNGSFIDPEGTTQIYIQGSGTHYAAFDAPANVSYLNARATAGSITNMSLLDATIMDGNGAVLEMDYNDGEEDTVKPLKDIVMNTPIYVAGLERGLHFVKIDNQGATGTFNLTLNCSPYGSIGYGNASGTFGFNEDTMVFTVTAEGSGFTGASDNGFLVYHVLEAGFEFIAKVTFPASGVRTGALGGLMVREDYEGNEAQARYVFSGLSRTATGYNAITRVRSTVAANPIADPVSVAAGDGYYVRLHYGGNGSPIVTNYSSNGKTWSADYIASVHLVPPLYVGYAVSSALDNSNLQVNYSNIQYVDLELEEE